MRPAALALLIVTCLRAVAVAEPVASETPAHDQNVATRSPWIDEAPALALDLKSDPDLTPKDYRLVSGLTVAGLYAGFSAWAYIAWYRNHPEKDMHDFGRDGWFGKNTYAGGADKLGHFWASMATTRLAVKIMRAGHWELDQASYIAAAWAAAFYTAVEVKDGYFYQFSYGDEVANLLGAAVAVALEMSPRLDDLVDIRVEYWPSPEYLAILDGAEGADVNSANVAEDYSGQTYLLALHLGEVYGLGDMKYGRPFRYIDGVVGFQTRHYKPDLHDPDFERGDPTQELSIGLSINLQGVFDDLLRGKDGRRHVRATLAGLTEVFNPPFGSLRVGASRSTDAGMIIPE